MLTSVRDADGGGYKVVVHDETGQLDERHTDDLADAFAMQQAVADTGKWPDGKEPGK